jgi:alkylated DNA repair dioxygenase AlkB
LLKDEVEAKVGSPFNFVLVNYYADGKDSISPHSDDEAFLGPLPCIASLSLGSPRDFHMKHKENKSLATEKWNLTSGTMIVMRGETQSKWLHSIPKRAHGKVSLFPAFLSDEDSCRPHKHHVSQGDLNSRHQ